MKNTHSYGISIARTVATIFIVLCHIFQSLDNRLSLYFNVGVQIFLFMSGYLYGSKQITKFDDFFRKSIVKLLIPYYLMLICIIAVNLFKGESLGLLNTISSLLCLQWYGYSIPNCGHLWYISCIIFCYAIIPLLQHTCQWLQNKKRYYYWIVLAGILVVTAILFVLNALPQNPTMIIAFIAGYFVSFGKLENEKILSKKIMPVWLAIGIIGFVVKYVLESRCGTLFPSVLTNYYKVFLGGAIFLTLKEIRISESFDKIKKALKISDKYSYCVYLTHHIFILGSLSVMHLTTNVWINSLIAIGLTILFSYILCKVFSLISGKLFKLEVKKS